MNEREVNIIIHGDAVIKQMGEAEKAAFMAAFACSYAGDRKQTRKGA